MTEAETLEVLSDFANNTATYFTMLVSFTFAYLTVAYFVGRSLSRFQCLAISGLYLISALVSGTTTVGWAQAWLTLREREATMLDDVWLFNDIGWIGMVSFLFITIAVVSMYFMYDVRKRQRE
jgi:hypothetical protein